MSFLYPHQMLNILDQKVDKNTRYSWRLAFCSKILKTCHIMAKHGSKGLKRSKMVPFWLIISDYITTETIWFLMCVFFCSFNLHQLSVLKYISLGIHDYCVDHVISTGCQMLKWRLIFNICLLLCFCWVKKRTNCCASFVMKSHNLF